MTRKELAAVCVLIHTKTREGVVKVLDLQTDTNHTFRISRTPYHFTITDYYDESIRYFVTDGALRDAANGNLIARVTIEGHEFTVSDYKILSSFGLIKENVITIYDSESLKFIDFVIRNHDKGR